MDWEEITEEITRIVKQWYRTTRWLKRLQHYREKIFRLYIRSVVLPNKRRKKTSRNLVLIRRNLRQQIYLGYGYFLVISSDGSKTLKFLPGLSHHKLGQFREFTHNGFPIYPR